MTEAPGLSRTGQRPSSSDPADDRGATGSAIAVLVGLAVLLPITRFVSLWNSEAGAGDFNRSATIGPLDLALLGVFVVALVGGPPLRLPRSVAGRVGAAFAGAVAVSIAIHPSWTGLEHATRLVAVLAIVRVSAFATDRHRRLLLGTFVAVGILNAVMALVQARTGASIGLGFFELGGTGLERGDLVAGRGSFQHEYQLATMLLAAGTAAWVLATTERSAFLQRVWGGSVALIGFGSMFAFGRAALIGWALGIAVAVIRGDRLRRTLAAALVIGLALGLALSWSGWTERANETSDLERIDNLRRENLQDAIDLWRDDPIVGVGLGRNVLIEEARGDELPQPPHDIVFHALAETGLLGTIPLLALLGFGAAWAWRSTVDALVGVAFYAPMILLDAVPYVFPQGLVGTAFWIIALRLSRSAARTTAICPDTTGAVCP